MSRQAFAMVPYAAVVDKKLSNSDLRALAVIAARRDYKTGDTQWPLSYLAKLAGLEGERAGEVFGRSVKRLQEFGYVSYQPGSGKVKSRIRVLMDATPFPEASDGTDAPDPVSDEMDPPEEWAPSPPARCTPPHSASGDSPHSTGGDKSDTYSDTSIQTPHTPRKRGVVRAKPALTGFEIFWGYFPRRVGKGAAEAAWPAAVAAAGGDPGVVIDGLKCRLHFSEVFDPRDNWRFCPHPATWLRRRGWEDDLPTASPNTGAHHWPERGSSRGRESRRAWAFDRHRASEPSPFTGTIIEGDPT